MKFKIQTLFSTQVRNSKAKHYFQFEGIAARFQLQNSKP